MEYWIALRLCNPLQIHLLHFPAIIFEKHKPLGDSATGMRGWDSRFCLHGAGGNSAGINPLAYEDSLEYSYTFPLPTCRSVIIICVTASLPLPRSRNHFVTISHYEYLYSRPPTV